MTEKESMEIISRMLINTQHRLENGSGKTFLIWGYTSILITLSVMFALIISNNNPFWNLLWFAIPIVGWLLTYLLKVNKSKGVKTYVDISISYLWIVLTIIAIVLAFFSFYRTEWFQLGKYMTFLILLIMGGGVVISGKILKFKPLTIGGSICMGLSLLLPFLFTWINTSWEGEYFYVVQSIIFILAIASAMIIPGHILDYRGKKAYKLANESNL